ncbi:hemin transport system permease protein [Glaciecola sp. KUL10]|nr:hemin transport system permease protein [Glaciecola sp. KUL10]
MWWQDDIERYIVLNIKLPVVLTAILVGAAICVSAASLQVLLRNPLADPGLIGISSGASLVAACLILIGGLPVISEWLVGYSTTLSGVLQTYILAFACFLGAILSAFLIMKLAKRMMNTQSAVILMGIGISTIAGAIIGWLYLIAPPSSIKSLTFWLMGSLHNTDMKMLMLVSPVFTIGGAYLLHSAKYLNLLYLDANSARLNGLDVERFERRILVISAMLVGLSVSIAGSIAFLGLLVPHFVRAVIGHDNRHVLVLSSIVGATFLIMTALFNELLFVNLVPLSMITASIGGPLFIFALLKQRH